MKSQVLALRALAIAIVVPGAALAADGDGSWSGSLGLGAEYDSNVAILELDVTSGESDYAGLVDLGIAYDRNVGDSGGVTLGYDFSQSLHSEFSEFDLQIHRGSIDAGYDLGVFEGGLMGHYAYAGLDGEEFLVLQQLSPYVSKLFGERLFLRGAYAYTDKEYKNNPSRAADTQAVSGDVYVFLSGLNSYLVFGIKHEEEDAVDGQFDYDGQRFSAQWARRIHAMQRKLVFKTRLRYETRDYAEPTPSIGVERQDRRYLLNTSLDIPLTERLTAGAVYEYADNRSNLPAVDFEEHVVSVRLGFEF